jgi:predicted HTH domain antitoxin
MGLGQGELEAIVLYKNINADFLLIDDRRAKKFAKLNGVNVIGSLGVMILAKDMGFVESIREDLEKLVKSSLFISQNLVDKDFDKSKKSHKFKYNIKIKKEQPMQTITLPQIEIDYSILLSLKNSADELAYKMKLYTAIVLYQKRQLSLGKSAQLLGMDRLSFINVLKDEGIAIFDYNDREMSEVFEGADKLGKMLKGIK